MPATEPPNKHARAGLRRLALVIVPALAALVIAPPAMAGWNQPVGGASPINQSDSLEGTQASLAEVGGVPYVAWIEYDGTNYELRIVRFDGSTNTWQQPWAEVDASYGGANQSTTLSARRPSVADVGGVPHVAWTENDAMNYELRVARLNLDTNRWEQPWTGVSATSGGINQSASRSANEPSLTAVGGVPHVAWSELDGANYELRVARLNSGTNGWEQPWTGASADSGAINQSSSRDAGEPSLAAVGGVPHVAWSEYDGTNYELRVASLNGSTWGQPWTGVSADSGAINQSSSRDAVEPSLSAVGGVPHVAWAEYDGTNAEVRVARPDDRTPSWKQPWTGVSAGSGGINQNAENGSARWPSLALVGGVPHVAWVELNGTNYELRVARPRAGAWGQPWPGVTDTSGTINQSTSRDAGKASLAAVGGVPYVAWPESDATNQEARVSRLEPEFASQGVVASDTAATLTARVRTYGIPYPVGFQYGAGLEHETTTDTAAAGSETVTITRRVAGLIPATAYPFRPFATAGVPAPRVPGMTGSFTTQAATQIAPPARSPRADTLAPSISRLSATNRRFRVGRRSTPIVARRAREGTTFGYALSEPARVTVAFQRAAPGRRAGGTCRKPTRRLRDRRSCTRFLRVGRTLSRAGRAGSNTLRFSGRTGPVRLRVGRHRAVFVAADPAGNRSRPARMTFTVVRR